MDTIRRKSCAECIWNDQCKTFSSKCVYFDSINVFPTDDEIDNQIELKRKNYHNLYQKYIQMT